MRSDRAVLADQWLSTLTFTSVPSVLPNRVCKCRFVRNQESAAKPCGSSVALTPWKRAVACNSRSHMSCHARRPGCPQCDRVIQVGGDVALAATRAAVLCLLRVVDARHGGELREAEGLRDESPRSGFRRNNLRRMYYVSMIDYPNSICSPRA